MIAWEQSGQGRPAVFVHGITEDRRAWDPLMPHLNERYRCIRLDLRGHGESSDADDYSALAMADDVATVVAEAGLDEPPLLVGHSLGGFVVTIYATQAPARAVVNIDQSLRLGDFATALQPLADQLRGDGFADAMNAVIDALGTDRLPEPSRSYVMAKHAAARPEVVLGVWSTVLDSSPAELTALAESLLPAVQMPYHALHGSDPGADYAAWLGRLVPSADVTVWDGDGHYPHLVEPDRFVAWLDEV